MATNLNLKSQATAESDASTTNAMQYRPRIESFGIAHNAVDFDMANLSMVQVADGYVVIDTGTTPANALAVNEHWQRIAGGKVQALIYTHSHTDHIGGASIFDLEGVPIWAQRNFEDEVDITQMLPNAYFTRGSKQFGFRLPEDLIQTNGIGRPLRLEPGPRSPFVMPTHHVDVEEELTIGGEKFILHATPGETHDQMAIWLPDRKVIFPGDNFYKAFPNLYAIRGVAPRPVRQWIDSLDYLRRLDPMPEVMLLGHTEPVVGAEKIRELLTVYRDAIAFVHDSVVRGINAGLGPYELVNSIVLPQHLRKHPYLRELYGTLKASIRGIYQGYMGWFDGDAANLDPVELPEISPWLVKQLGGQAKVKSMLDEARLNGEHRRALWLSQLLHTESPTSKESKYSKAAMLEEAAELHENPLMRNWRLTEAAELSGTCKKLKKPVVSGDTIADVSVERILRLMPSRVNPEKTKNVVMTLGFDITDLDKQYTLFIRNGVGELAPGLAEKTDLTVRATDQNFKRVFLAGEISPATRKFWQSLKFEIPETGILTPIRRLLRLARIGQLFIRP